MVPSDELLELLLDSYDDMPEEERQNWTTQDARDWVHDRRLYEKENNLPPIECDEETVFYVMRDFITQYCDE